MIKYILGWIARWCVARGRHISIRPNDEPYIERYTLFHKWGWGVFLHQYFAADSDREIHNHPWKWSVGIPLVGGYREERLTHLCPILGPHCALRNIFRFRPNVIKEDCFHRISDVDPGTWTLFIHGKRRGGWGFLYPTKNADGTWEATFRCEDEDILAYTRKNLEAHGIGDEGRG